MLKFCPKCEQEKDISDFGINKSSRDGLQCYCRPCTREVTRKRKSDPYTRWEQELWRKYKMTPYQYEIKLKEQDGVCGICRLSCTTGDRLCVDHDHTTGMNRGLLCHNCNHGIGMFQDNAELLYRAANYLSIHREVRP